MDHIYVSTIFFDKAVGLDDAFTEVGTPSDREISSPSEDERMCDKYGGYTIPSL